MVLSFKRHLNLLILNNNNNNNNNPELTGKLEMTVKMVFACIVL